MWTPEKPKIINLLKANRSELTDFADQVQRRNGKVQVFVHPFYDESNQLSYILPLYQNRRDKFIQRCSENKIPLVIFEEKRERHHLAKRLRGRHVNKPVYTITTEDRNPLPTGETKSWTKLISILKCVRVKKIVIGGQLLIFYDDQILIDPEKDDHMPSELYLSGGCVGVLARHLWIENFQVILSPISSPRIVI